MFVIRERLYAHPVYLEIPRHILHHMYMGKNIKVIYITLKAGFELVISANEKP